MPIIGPSSYGLMPHAPVVQTESSAPAPPANSIHAGASAGVSSGLHGARDTSRHGEMGTGLRMLLVPALELADMAIAMTCQTQPVSVADATAAYLGGVFTEDLWECICKIAGADVPLHKAVRHAMRRKPEIIDTFTLRNREFIDDKSASRSLRNLGFTDPGELANMLRLRFEVPGPSDLVRFAVRHGFEPEILESLGYNAEYRPALDFYHQTAGLNYRIFTGPLRDTIVGTLKEFPDIFQAVRAYAAEINVVPPGSPDATPEWFAARYTSLGLPEPTWAVMYWWAHWVLPSPGQGYEMLFRLSPDRDKTGEPAWMQREEFDLDQLRLLLRANDYPPFWRDKLAAIAYRPPNLRFLRVQLQTQTIDRAGAVSQLRQMGFRADYAAQQADALIAQIDEQRAEKLLKIVLKDLESGWELGLVEDSQLTDTLIHAGIDPDEADARVNAAIYARQVKIGAELVKQARAGYLRYTFDWTQTDQFLTQIGILPKRRAEYQRRWDAERQARRKEATASELKKAAIDGTLDLPSYAQRLRNMGWTDDAINLALADVRLVRSKREQQALTQMAREETRTQEARLKALRAAEASMRSLRADLARHGSPSRLKTWYCNGDISAADVTMRLKMLLWPQDDIDRLLGECDAKRAKAGLPPYSEEAPGAES